MNYGDLFLVLLLVWAAVIMFRGGG